jgi:AsmA protein
MPPRRRRKTFPVLPVLRAAAAVGAIGVLVLGLAAAAAMLLVDPNAYKPDIVAAVKRATGRNLVLRGPMHVRFGLPPWLVAEDVLLSNAVGGSRPEMLTLQRIDARVALLPLLYGGVEVTELDLFRPDLLLETDAAGHGNWQPAPKSREAAAAAPAGPEPAVAPDAPAATASTPSNPGTSVQAVHISEARIGWRDGRNGHAAAVTLPSLDGLASGPNGSMLLSGTMVSGGRTLTLNGEIGSIGRLLDAVGTYPWPVRLTAEGDGFRFDLRGSMVHPLRGEGVSLQAELVASDLAALDPFMPPELPAPHDANISATIEPSSRGSAQVSKTSVHIGGLKLPTLLPGIDIAQADLFAPGLDQPVHIDLEGSGPSGPMRLLATFGLFGALLPGAPPPEIPVPTELTLEAGRTLISAKGQIASPATLSGVDGDLFIRIADLAALGPLLGHSLPALQQITLAGHVFGGLDAAGGLGLRGATLTMPEAQITGELDFRFGTRPSVHGSVSAQQVNLDSLLTDIAANTTANAPAATPAAVSLATDEPATPAPPVPAAPEHPIRAISDRPFDLSLLDRGDADIGVTVAALQTGDVTYNNVLGHLVLRDGRLTLDPFGGTAAGGGLAAKLSIDSRGPAPPVSATLHASVLALAPILAAIGQPNAVSGTVAIDAELHGAGRTPHAVAGSLDGHVAIGLANGEVDSRLVAAALGEVLKTAKLPDAVLNNAGRLKLRCFALGTEVHQGVVTVATLLADATRLVVQGDGSIDLGQETLALRLRPILRLGPGLVVPVRVSGSFLEPKVAIDAGSGKGGVLGAAVAALAAGERGGGEPCAPALNSIFAPSVTAAAATAGEAAPAKPSGKPGKPLDALRTLVH